MHAGIDIGTTAVKAMIFDPDGTQLGSGRAATPWQGVPTGREASPGAMLEAAEHALGEALSEAGGGQVSAVGITSMGQTGTVVAHGGRALLPMVAWDDQRTVGVAHHLVNDIGVERFAAICGLRAGPSWSTCQLALQRRTGALALGAGLWLNLAEWVAFAWTGLARSERSLASQSGLLDLTTANWSQELLEWAAWSRDGMPPIQDAGQSWGIAKAGPAKGAMITVAGHDHLVGAFGADALAGGCLYDSCGTAETLVRTAAPLADSQVRVAVAELGLMVGWHVVPGCHAVSASHSLTAALGRVLELLGKDSPGDIAAAEYAADDIAVENLFASTFDIHVRRATPSSLWRAALDAAAAQALQLAGSLSKLVGPHDRTVVAGGWTLDAAFMAARDRAFGTALSPTVPEPGAAGAARIAEAMLRSGAHAAG
jgi:sugar (pentulose or hexulose) kinase